MNNQQLCWATNNVHWIYVYKWSRGQITRVHIIILNDRISYYFPLCLCPTALCFCVNGIRLFHAYKFQHCVVLTEHFSVQCSNCTYIYVPEILVCAVHVRSCVCACVYVSKTKQSPPRLNSQRTLFMMIYHLIRNGTYWSTFFVRLLSVKRSRPRHVLGCALMRSGEIKNYVRFYCA